MSHIIPFPASRSDQHGIVHVMGGKLDGFYVSHESASGNSWGELFGPFEVGQDAIALAYAVNRDHYGGACDVAVCANAREDGRPATGAPYQSGEW